ncbi:MAG TPA: LptF/LptG family permease [Gemmataceae bacterium]|nr:LptF/LptG family permease [Gemmataceae bacterium]
MFWGIIHRMILVELIKVFCMALIALTGIIMVAGIISEAMKNGFGPAQIMAIIPLLLPSLLPYTVPTTTLFATCIVYGRLSADNEILALKAAGAHIVHVIWPAVLLGVVASAVTMVLFLDLIPYTGYRLRTSVISDVEELLYIMLRKDGNIKHPRLSVEIDVKNVVGRTLQDAIFKRKGANGDYDVIASAKEAELRVDVAHKLIHVHMRQCNILQANGGIGYVESKVWPVDLPPDFIGNTNKTRAMDMTWTELFEYYEKFGRELEEIEHKRNVQIAEGGLNPAAQKEILRNLQTERQFRVDMMNSIRAEWHMRPALVLGCLCFALVGCPVGIWFSKSDYLSAFITCFLPIVIVYYPLMFCMYDMGRVGKVPPYLGVYNADLLMLIAGAVLFRRLARN